MSEEITPSCGWQGYGFGAPYEDACCCQGKACDLDSGDAPGMVHLGDERCPNCQGTGVQPAGQPMYGVQALRIERMFCELADDVEAIAPEQDADAVAHAARCCARIMEIKKSVQVLHARAEGGAS